MEPVHNPDQSESHYNFLFSSETESPELPVYNPVQLHRQIPKHPYSSLKSKMIKPRPRPPRTELAKQSLSASDGVNHDANNSTVDSSMKLPQRIYTRLLLNSGPILRASATHASISTIAVKSKRSRMETEKAGKPTNDPTKVISIQARYTPSPRNANGIGTSTSRKGR